MGTSCEMWMFSSGGGEVQGEMREGAMLYVEFLFERSGILGRGLEVEMLGTLELRLEA